MPDKRRRVRLQDAEEKFFKIPGVRQEYESRYAGTKAVEMIRTLREKAGLSQQELAEICGFKQSAISRLENKVPKLGPSFETLARVAKACGRKIRVRFEKLSSEEKESRNTPTIIAEYPEIEMEETNSSSSASSTVLPNPSASFDPVINDLPWERFSELDLPFHPAVVNPARQVYYMIPPSHVESVFRDVITDAVCGSSATTPSDRVSELTKKGMALLAEGKRQQRLSPPTPELNMPMIVPALDESKR